MLDNLPLTWRPGRLATNTLIFTAGLVMRALLQAALFIAVARSLGPQGYGEFIAVVAMMTVFTPLVGSGAAALLVRDVARRPGEFPVLFSRGLLMIGVTAAPLMAIASWLAFYFLPAEISRTAVFNVALAEILFVPIADLAARAYQPFERLGRMAALSVVVAMLRLLGFGTMLLFGAQIDPPTWAGYYLAATGVAALIGIGLVTAELGRPHWTFKGPFTALREGFYFALAGSAGRVHAEIDKVLLARLESLHIAGIYSAAHRVVDLLTLPIAAFMEASLARFFRAGEGGTAASARYALRLLPFPATYALTAGLALFVFSGALPWLLGPSFTDSADVVCWLAPLPFLTLIRYFLATIAGVSGRQRMSGIVHGVGAALNTGLNMLWIPLWGWKGAVLATFAAEGLMVLVFFLGVTRTATAASKPVKAAEAS